LRLPVPETHHYCSGAMIPRPNGQQETIVSLSIGRAGIELWSVRNALNA